MIMKTVKSNFKFKGGVHPDYNKELARGKAIETLPMPAELVVSMSQHLGAPAKCVVKVGDFVTRGQVIGEKNGFISVCVRAPADGLVKSVEKRLGPAGGKADAVVLDTTGNGERGTGNGERGTGNGERSCSASDGLEGRLARGAAEARRRGRNLRHGRRGLPDRRKAESAARQAL